MTFPSCVDELAKICARSMRRPLPPELRDGVDPLVREIETRHPGALATLLYGSCLRGGRLEGVPDFLLIVDDYAEAYTQRRLRLANRWFPPNVFALFAEDGQNGPLRAKYAVVDLADLRRATRGPGAHCFLWARLCQPIALLSVRDAASCDAVAACAADAVVAMVAVALAQRMPQRSASAVDPGELWSTGFAETYRAEWRFEPRARTLELIADDPGYYREATDAAIARLERTGALTRSADGITLDAAWARRQRRRWNLRRPVGKTLAALRLLKSALTFGDWVPYALWKMERHTGVRLEASPAQRRHPFLLGWPLIVRALRQRLLR